MKEYKIKVTKELIKKLKPYWKELKKIEGDYNRKTYNLEKKMEKETGIKEIEFIKCDGEYCGIGNAERTMRLIHAYEELESY